MSDPTSPNPAEPDGWNTPAPTADGPTRPLSQRPEATANSAFHDLPTTPPRTGDAQDNAPGPVSPRLGQTAAAVSRFHILRPHAKGGLGQVSVARDDELGREVALKEIQERHADDPASRARFLREAEVTGRLEHPGVVPVYGLGRHPDGRPFYAMRFIRGDSLKDAIKKFHQADAARRDPGERALALRQLLGRFTAVCNAVAYAHSRGVLHRDLKADNVMLGEYGETLVVDWGLAKVLGRPEEAAGPAEKLMPAAEPDDAAATRAGAILGTPAFMPPEQALGEAEKLGPASDVYSLGALLYQLLTGRAPFEGVTALDVLMRVAEGNFPPPRRVKAAVPAALEAVCLKAMALKPEDRYGSAQALADDVEHWLADEPVGAWREPWRRRVGRWARRHKTAVGAAAAGVLVAVLAGGVGLWWWERQETERRQAVAAALDRVGRLQEQARWAEARAVMGQARDRLGESGPAALQDRLERARTNLDLVAALDAIRLRRATLVAGKVDWAGAARAYEAAFAQAGLGRAGDDPEEVARRVRASDVRGALVAALDDWAASAPDRRAWVLGVARRADPDEWRDRLRDPVVWRKSGALARLARRVAADRLTPPLAAALGSLAKEWGGLDLLRAGQKQFPGDFWLNCTLAYQLRDSAPDEAAGYYRAALAVRPGTSAIHHNLARVHQAQRRLPEAIAEYRRAIALDPRLALAHTNLGLALEAVRQPDEAIAEHRRAVALDPNFALAHYNLGRALQGRGRLDEAIAAYRTAVAKDRTLARAHSNLGVALWSRGKADEAAREFRKAIDLDPGLSGAHTNLGVVLQARGRLDEAIREFGTVAAQAPTRAGPHVNLGLALQARGRWAEAAAAFRKATALAPRNAGAHFHLGNALKALGRWDEAAGAYRKAATLKPRDAQAHANLGAALARTGRLGEAAAAYRQAIALDPRSAQLQTGLGQALLQLGQFTEAMQALRRGADLIPAEHPSQKSLGQLLRACEQGLALERKLAAVLAGTAQPADAAEGLALARLCARTGRQPLAAARLYDAALAAEPQRANNLRAGHRYAAACSAARAAARLGAAAARLSAPERGRWRKQAIAWLRADLERWATKLADNRPQGRARLRRQLRTWQQEADLAGLRDAAALANLPDDEEAACRKLWTDVAGLLKKAEG